MSVFQDKYGKDITEGCTIAMAFRSGNHAEIRIGKVIEFVQSKTPYYGNPVDKMRIQWLTQRAWDPKTSLVEKSKNCVVLEHGYEL